MADEQAVEEAQNVKVMVRVRPFNKREIAISKKNKERLNSVVRMRGTTCVILEHSVDGSGFPVEKEREAFTFDECFWSMPMEQEVEPSINPFANQKMVYDASGKVALDNAFDGFNTCIFAYGQTGSGKTHSMLGCDEDPGISPRLVDELFERITKMKATTPTSKCEVEVMFFEIYNEKVRDLFNEKRKTGEYDAPRIRQHPTKGVFVEGLARMPCDNNKKCKALMEKGTNERAMAATKMNAHSSRSHAVFQIQLTQNDALKGTQRVSTMNLVDLAGSEKVKMSEATGDQFTEAKNINQSLSTLRRVIDVLIENSQSRRQKPPPFRESVLTYLLSDSLGGNSKTMMLSAVSPHESNIEDTLGTLRYALRAKAIVCNAKVNEEKSALMMDAMRDEIMALRVKLASGEGVEGGEGRPMMPEEIQAEIAMREAEVAKMEEKEQEMTQQLHAAEERLQEVELQQQELSVAVSTHKRERFAAAFRNAFLIAQDKKRIEASTAELEAAKAQVVKMQDTVDMLNADLNGKNNDIERLERTVEKGEQDVAAERARADAQITAMTKANQALAEDKATLQTQLEQHEVTMAKLEKVKGETDLRMQAMQEEMIAGSRKIELIAAEKHAVIARLEEQARKAAAEADEMRRAKEKYKLMHAEELARTEGMKRVADERNKDRMQLLETVKAQQQLLAERSALVEQMQTQCAKHAEDARKATETAEKRDAEVKILVESLREYEAASGKWMSEHSAKDRELKHMRQMFDASQSRPFAYSAASAQAAVPASPLSPNAASPAGRVTPRRAQSPSAAGARSPYFASPPVNQYDSNTSAASPRPRWA